ncbi:MAG: aldolase/citrate lyase family protein [Thermovirgaceae bacterium]|nr:4-hydroxy-2-oxovalerate aldolase [Synergistaceae bacterium]
MKNLVRMKLEAQEVVTGPFVGINSPDMVEILGLSGFDLCVIDTEHGPMDPESIQPLIRAAELSGMTPVVRVPRAEPVEILKVLDVGAHCIHVPQVNSPETARVVARAARYHPAGMRGVAVPRALSYGLRPLGEALEEANREVMVIVHCENVSGLDRIDEIAAVEGVDMVFVGPYDLSQSLGVPGEIFHPSMVKAVARALEAIKRAGKPAGIFVTSPEEAERRIGEGFRYIGYSVDSLIFGKACREIVSTLKSRRQDT